MILGTPSLQEFPLPTSPFSHNSTTPPAALRSHRTTRSRWTIVPVVAVLSGLAMLPHAGSPAILGMGATSSHPQEPDLAAPSPSPSLAVSDTAAAYEPVPDQTELDVLPIARQSDTTPPISTTAPPEPTASDGSPTATSASSDSPASATGVPLVVESGITFFVDSSGSDANAGSAEAPWASLQHAFDVAPAGATVYVRAGNYSGARLSRSGLTIANYAAEAPVVSGTLLIDAVTSATVRGLVAQGATATFQAGFHVLDSSGVTLEGNTARGNSLGMYLDNATDAVIEENTLTDNAYGLEIHGRTDGTTVRANLITSNNSLLDSGRSAGGVNFYRTSGGLLFADNTVTHNREVALEIYGASDLVIRGNVLTGSNDLIETGTEQGWACNNLKIVHNIGYNSGALEPHESGFYLRCASNSLVAHNTLVGLDRFAFGIMAGGPFAGSIEGLRIVNNIAAFGRPYSLDACLPDSVVIDYNVSHPATGPVNGDAVAWVACAGEQAHSVDQLRALTGYDRNGVMADPQFIDAVSGDYRLAAGSPALDMALKISGINDQNGGAGPDAGRWER